MRGHGIRTGGIALAAAAALSLGCGAPAEKNEPVLLRVADDPTVTLKVWFKVGAQNDPAGKEGLAALTASMLSEGSTQNNTYEEILRKLYPLASGYGAGVDREMTVLTGRTHRDNLPTFQGLFADAYLRPAFSQADFDRLRTDALNYLENTLRYSSDEELGKAALYDFVFQGTAYAHPENGTVSGLKSITLDDVKAFYAQYYTRDNVVMALGGGFDDALVRDFQATAEELPAGTGRAAAPDIAVPAVQGRQVLLVDKPEADSSISLGFPIDVHRGERDYYALWIANSWLGEHRNSASHLYQVIREARGLNYGDYSYIESFPNGGRRSFPPTHVGRRHQIFEIWIRTLPNANAHFALRAAMRELTDLVEGGMSQEEFDLTRDFMKKYILHFADTTSSRLGYAVDDRFYGIEGEGSLARFRTMLDQVTRDDVNAAIRKHLQVANVKIAIVTGDAAGLKQALAADSPSPIEYPTPKPAEVVTEDEEIARFPLPVREADIHVVSVKEIFER